MKTNKAFETPKIARGSYHCDILNQTWFLISHPPLELEHVFLGEPTFLFGGLPAMNFGCACHWLIPDLTCYKLFWAFFFRQKTPPEKYVAYSIDDFLEKLRYHTVDGSEILHDPLRLVVYPIIYKVWCTIPRWFLVGFLPTVLGGSSQVS